MVSSVIDLLLRTLFNIEAASVVTLSVESYPFVFAVLPPLQPPTFYIGTFDSFKGPVVSVF